MKKFRGQSRLFSLLICILQIILTLSFVLNKDIAVVKADAFTHRIIVSPSSVVAGAASNYTINYQTAVAVSGGKKITIEFPAGFNLSAVDFTDIDLADGSGDIDLAATPTGDTWGVAIAGQIITFTSGARAISAEAEVAIKIGTNAASGDQRIINTSTVGNNYYVTITTLNGSTPIDASIDSTYFQIFASQSETVVGGLYYLRNTRAAHNQGDNYTGTNTDLGALTKIPPTEGEIETCNQWTAYTFDQEGTYTQTNNINNIYYHVWWQTQDFRASLGPDKTGKYNISTSESIPISSDTSVVKSNNYYLSTAKQSLTSPLSIVGNNIYNFTIKLAEDQLRPVTYSSPTQTSFVILNLPDDLTNGISGSNPDSDNDGLTDEEELFTYFTNPYNNDTDGDTLNNPLWTDGYEVSHGMNPNEYDSSPSFGANLHKRLNGSSANDYFGNSISAIGDQDGDSKEDIIVGAPYANPGGRNDAGSVYIYSSATGDLIKQFDGQVAGEAFGFSVSRIGDQDSDGKEDVIVGAPLADPGGVTDAGSVYILSTDTSRTTWTAEKIIGLNGAASGDLFGNSVSRIGDQDEPADGKEDVIVGAFYSNSFTGAVYIYSSTSANPLKQFAGDIESGKFGFSIASISDQDNPPDGKEDIVVGAPFANLDDFGNTSGSVFILSTDPEKADFATSTIKRLNGELAGDQFGSSVTAIDDQEYPPNGDDIVVGDVNANQEEGSTGSVYILSADPAKTDLAASIIKRLNGELVGGGFGSSVAPISDQDGDGNKDILVFAPATSWLPAHSINSVYLLSSNPTKDFADSIITRYQAETQSADYGLALSAIGDQNGDNKEEILVGSPLQDVGSQNDGAAYLYLTGNEISDYSWLKGSSLTNVLAIDSHFYDNNSSTISIDPIYDSENLTYSYSGNNHIAIDINSTTHLVSFSAPSWWAGNETVTFRATDSSGLSVESNPVTLTVLGISDNEPIDFPTPIVSTITSSSITDTTISHVSVLALTTNADSEISGDTAVAELPADDSSAVNHLLDQNLATNDNTSNPASNTNRPIVGGAAIIIIAGLGITFAIRRWRH